MAGRPKKPAARKTASAPKPRVRERASAGRAKGESVTVAAELPVTRAMLGEMRTELLERIDQAKSELKAELTSQINDVKAELRAEINDVKAELKAELRAEINSVKAELTSQINSVKAELRAEINSVKAELTSQINSVKAQLDVLQAGQHELKAQMARTCFLVEEQNARNKVVFDALTALMQRQDRHEHRMDQLEETVRSLVSARAAGP